MDPHRVIFNFKRVTGDYNSQGNEDVPELFYFRQYPMKYNGIHATMDEVPPNNTNRRMDETIPAFC